MNKIIFVPKGLYRNLVQEITGKFCDVGKLDLDGYVNRSVIDFFGVDSNEYYEVLNDEGRRRTPNTMFTITVESVYNYFDEVTYKGDFITSDEDVVPLTIDEARDFVSNYCVKPILNYDIYGRRAAVDAMYISKLMGGVVLCGYYDNYLEQVLPFIKKFGRENVIEVDNKEYNRDTIFEYLESLFPKIESE